MESLGQLLDELRAVVGRDYVVCDPEDLIVFEQDASVDRAAPLAVVLPESTEQVAEVVKIAARHGTPIVPRGAGTGLSGGAVAEQGGVLLTLTRMNRILDVDVPNRTATVEPGVVNIDLSDAVAQHGLYFAPDPSSQRACTIGGNVAENSGGPHCLAYGVTTNHVLGLEAVLADGSVVRLGGAAREAPGYDLRGVLIGSEGTLAIVTKATVCLLRRPEAVRTLLAVYEEMDDASAAVSSIVASGIVPAAIEMMDDVAIAAVEPTVNAGYPGDAGAVLLVEVDGLAESVQEQSEEVEDICGRFRPMEIRTAADAAERERLWAGRKGAIGALGRLAPSYYLVDGTIPRTRLMEVMAKIKEISAESGYQIANVLHAGDGNLHPCILFDERSEEDTREALEVGGRILKLCVEVGGVLSGEHGIGTEKQEYMPLMFTDADMEAMAGLKPAFGADGMFNPGKIFPTGGSCVDIGQMSAVARAGAGAYI